jgi:hypothetical protein
LDRAAARPNNERGDLFLEFQAAGVTFAQTLRKEPWGAKTVEDGAR